MRKNVNCLLAVAALSLLAAQGCKNKDSTSTMKSGSGTASMSGGSTTPTASRSAPSSYTGTGSSGMSQTASDAANSTNTAARSAADSTGRAVRDAASDAQTATDTAGARASDAAGNTGKAASDASTSSASTTEAQKLLDQASQYIKDNKWDLADQSLTKVEQMKPQLPASYGTKIDATRKLFNSAKSGSNLLGGTGGPAK